MKIKVGKKFAAITVCVLVFAVVSLLHLFGAFHVLENVSYDLRVRLVAPYLRISDNIIVILVNQDSIEWAQQERGWGWPWPRKAYAEMLEYMNLSGASSVIFDMIYAEPSVHGTEDDNYFAHASQAYGKAVKGIFFSSQLDNISSWPIELNVPLFDTIGFGGFLDQFGQGRDGYRLIGGLFPIQELRDVSGTLGSVTGISDPDNIFRRLRLFTFFDGKAVPGLAAASLLINGYGRDISFDPQSQAIRWDNLVIPVDKNGKSLLRFRGSLDRYIPYSARNILLSHEAYQRGDEPLYPPEDFTGCHVFIGLFAPGLFDIVSTPISSVYPGMGMHVTMLDNILSGDFVRESRFWLNLLILLAVVSLTVFLCLFSRHVLLSVGGAVFIVLGIISATFAAYLWGYLWLPMVVHLAGIVAAFVSATLYNYATEGRQKRFIKSAFSQYLSPKVIEQIIADPTQLKLGGEKRKMTAVFTDVRAFSTISEMLNDPEKLVELLNYYLTRMSDIILENQGTIDKYTGDAIISFFGAPIHMDNHASLACRSAIMMKKAEIAINREVIAQGLITEAVLNAMMNNGKLQRTDESHPLFTRIGINTGDMVVGNMGTPSKMDYTVMGNAVNLASRIEGINKHYNTGGILISENTREHIGDEFALRPLSRVRVVGINTPLRLYELLDIRQDASPLLLEMVKNWEQGLALYEHKDFSGALPIFKEIFDQNLNDNVAKMYYNNSSKYSDSPPDDGSWDGGIDNLTEK